MLAGRCDVQKTPLCMQITPTAARSCLHGEDSIPAFRVTWCRRFLRRVRRRNDKNDKAGLRLRARRVQLKILNCEAGVTNAGFSARSLHYPTIFSVADDRGALD